MSVIESPRRQIQVGQRFTVEQTITPESIEAFAQVSKDRNPLHLDPDYAKNTRFRERIAPGMMVAGFISAALAGMSDNRTTLIYIEQRTRFRRPIRIGDTVTAIAEITAVEPDGKIHVATSCRNQLGKLVIDGEAIGLADPYPFDKKKELE